MTAVNSSGTFGRHARKLTIGSGPSNAAVLAGCPASISPLNFEAVYTRARPTHRLEVPRQLLE